MYSQYLIKKQRCRLREEERWLTDWKGMVGSAFCCFSFYWPVQVRVTSRGNCSPRSAPPRATTWFLQCCEPGPTFIRCRTSNLVTNHICTLNEIAQKVRCFSHSCLSCFLRKCGHTHWMTQLWFRLWGTRMYTVSYQGPGKVKSMYLVKMSSCVRES